MKKLEIELYRYDTLVFGKVLYMDESLRAKGTLEKHNGFSIISNYSPYLSDTQLYIQGMDREFDTCVFANTYSSIEETKETIDNIKACINAINSDPMDNSRIIKEI